MGWGTLDCSYPLENRPHFWPTLRAWLELPDDLTERPPVPLESVQLRPSRLDDPVLASLRRLVGEEAVRLDLRACAEHACGKAYRDLVRVRAGVIPNPPDAVVYPADEGQVAAMVAWAADRDILIIPFGGGSTVLGAVSRPRRPPRHQPGPGPVGPAHLHRPRLPDSPHSGRRDRPRGGSPTERPRFTLGPLPPVL